jgi:hypothetical protein
MINQQLAWQDQEKKTLILQIRELRQILHMTRQNLTNTIDQVEELVQLEIYFSINYFFFVIVN